ncbi:MAG: hypothetical protein DI536_16915 [Archangium gephyra]|uniref:Uncharacterized protein n=1 Tax=Archangium gephyra TaxID=48 RepID=A0A2W5V836_9BACT|nr:MAG: hypothetical protein DI536_16915 [Archangium gephyra]
MPPLDLGKRSGDELNRAVASAVTQLAGLNAASETVSAVGCVVQSKPATCQLIASTDKMKQRYFHLGAAVSDGDTKRIAVCVGMTDPRAKLPTACRSVFSTAGGSDAAPATNSESNCRTLPVAPNAVGQLCPPYLFNYSDDMKPADALKNLRFNFIGMVAAAHSTPIEPAELELTLGDKKYTALVGVMPTGTMAGWEMLQVMTALPDATRARTLTCVGDVKAGATRDGCSKKFLAMRDEAPIKVREDPPISLDGKAVPVTAGCREGGMAISCRDGALSIPEVDFAKLTTEERERLLSELVTSMVQGREVIELNTPVDCVIQGQPSRCLLSQSRKGQQMQFMIAGVVADGPKRRPASCGSSVDPRKTMPAVCSSIFSLKGTK